MQESPARRRTRQAQRHLDGPARRERLPVSQVPFRGASSPFPCPLPSPPTNPPHPTAELLHVRSLPLPLLGGFKLTRPWMGMEQLLLHPLPLPDPLADLLARAGPDQGAGGLGDPQDQDGHGGELDGDGGEDAGVWAFGPGGGVVVVVVEGGDGTGRELTVCFVLGAGTAGGAAEGVRRVVGQVPEGDRDGFGQEVGLGGAEGEGGPVVVFLDLHTQPPVSCFACGDEGSRAHAGSSRLSRAVRARQLFPQELWGVRKHYRANPTPTVGTSSPAPARPHGATPLAPLPLATRDRHPPSLVGGPSSSPTRNPSARRLNSPRDASPKPRALDKPTSRLVSISRARPAPAPARPRFPLPPTPLPPLFHVPPSSPPAPSLRCELHSSGRLDLSRVVAREVEGVEEVVRTSCAVTQESNISCGLFLPFDGCGEAKTYLGAKRAGGNAG